MTLSELKKAAVQKGYNLSEVWVDALEAAGVDNWEGYDEALTIYRKYLQDIYEDN